MDACVYLCSVVFVDGDFAADESRLQESLLIVQKEVQKPDKWENSGCIGLERDTIHGMDMDRICHGLSDVLCARA
jgi:hypothetical protein